MGHESIIKNSQKEMEKIMKDNFCFLLTIFVFFFKTKLLPFIAHLQ